MEARKCVRDGSPLSWTNYGDECVLCSREISRDLVRAQEIWVYSEQQIRNEVSPMYSDKRGTAASLMYADLLFTYCTIMALPDPETRRKTEYFVGDPFTFPREWSLHKSRGKKPGYLESQFELLLATGSIERAGFNPHNPEEPMYRLIASPYEFLETK